MNGPTIGAEPGRARSTAHSPARHPGIDLTGPADARPGSRTQFMQWPRECVHSPGDGCVDISPLGADQPDRCPCHGRPVDSQDSKRKVGSIINPLASTGIGWERLGNILKNPRIRSSTIVLRRIWSA